MSDRMSRWQPEDGPPNQNRADEDPDVKAQPLSGQPKVQTGVGSVTAGSIPADEDGPSPHLRAVKSPLLRWMGILVGGWFVFGMLAGVLWHLIVPLSTYQVNAEGYAATTERGLAMFIAMDVWFVVIGLVLGLLCGIICWSWFAGLGWPIVPLAIAGSLVMALLCWGVGWLLGPGSLQERLADAQAGDVLPIELTVRAPAALLAWPFTSVLVIMLISAFARDPEESSR